MAAALWSRFRRMSTRRITADNLNIAQISVKRIIKTQQHTFCPTFVPWANWWAKFYQVKSYILFTLKNAWYLNIFWIYAAKRLFILQ